MATQPEACKIRTEPLKFGTKEWAESNVNCITGCSRNCRYCYARNMAIRFKQRTENNWFQMTVRENAIKKNYRKRKGRIMFPTSHDIVVEQPFREACMKVLEKLFHSRNKVLITTKPNFIVVQEICERFIQYRDLMLFRFTIGAIDDNVIKFWEPNAPLFNERLRSLKYAFNAGFSTSVSIEPFLEKNPIPLVEKIEPYVSDTIWIGLMNHISRKNIPKKFQHWYDDIRSYYTIENIRKFYEILYNHPKIRWKESIKKLNLGLA